jgi:RNA polymerase sigma factor (sigma-70 family)
MLTDAVLVDRVIAGFDDAFEELYRRHANASWRVAQAVTGNADDAADAVSEAFARVLVAVKSGRLDDGDAFKSYLMAATRNSALDGLRKTGKIQPASEDQIIDLTDGATAADAHVGAVDAALVAQAFRNLPERWRSVLWLTEVEGIATKDAAAQLGMSPNGTAQLAVRARAGLRDRYLQAHVRNHARPECRFTVDHLGAYVGGGLAPRDLAKVDQHLAGCEDCRARQAELEDMGSTLRRIVLPLPLGLAAVSAAKVEVALASGMAPAAFAAGATGAGAPLAKVVQLAKEPTPAVRRFVGASAAGVLTLGLLSLGIIDRNREADAEPLTERQAASATTTLPDYALPVSYGTPLTGITTGAFGSGIPNLSSGPAGRTGYVAGAPGTAETAAPTGTAPAPSPSTASPAAETNDGSLICTLLASLCPPTSDPASTTPTVGVGANIGGTPIGVGVTVDETAPLDTTIGVNLGGTQVLAPAPAPSEPNTATVTAPVVGTIGLP